MSYYNDSCILHTRNETLSSQEPASYVTVPCTRGSQEKITRGTLSSTPWPPRKRQALSRSVVAVYNTLVITWKQAIDMPCGCVLSTGCFGPRIPCIKWLCVFRKSCAIPPQCLLSRDTVLRFTRQLTIPVNNKTFWKTHKQCKCHGTYMERNNT